MPDYLGSAQNSVGEYLITFVNRCEHAKALVDEVVAMVSPACSCAYSLTAHHAVKNVTPELPACSCVRLSGFGCCAVLR